METVVVFTCPACEHQGPPNTQTPEPGITSWLCTNCGEHLGSLMDMGSIDLDAALHQPAQPPIRVRRSVWEGLSVASRDQLKEGLDGAGILIMPDELWRDPGDGGTLDLGIVRRDTGLNRTNYFQMFYENFEGLQRLEPDSDPRQRTAKIAVGLGLILAAVGVALVLLAVLA